MEPKKKTNWKEETINNSNIYLPFDLLSCQKSILENNREILFALQYMYQFGELLSCVKQNI